MIHVRCFRQFVLSITCAILVISLILPTTAEAQQKPVVRIGILVDELIPENMGLLNQLQTEIESVVGEDADLIFPEDGFLANNLNIERAEEHYQSLLDGSVDLILAFGPVNNEVISGQESFPVPTMLFGAVNLDLIDFDEGLETSGINNFNYLIFSQSYTADLETFKTLADFDHVGILIAGYIPGGTLLQDLLDQLASDLGISYSLISYTGPESLEPFYETIDAVYLAEGFLLSDAEIQTLADTLFERRLPSFTSTTRGDVELGFMASNQSDENIPLLFRRIALNIEAFISGANLSELPLYLESNLTLTLNLNTARQVGVPIKFSLIATTEFVADIKNVSAEVTYNLVDVLEEVLDRNLLLGLSRKDVELADQDVQFAQSNYLPDVSASVSGAYIDQETAELSNGQNPEYSTDGNITLTQTIFSEAANANISIQKSLAQAERENLSATEMDLILSGASTYFTILILKSNLQIQNENLNVTRQNLQIAEQSFEAGQTGQADILRLRSQLAQNTQALVEAVNDLEQGFNALNELLNQDIDREIDVQDAEISEGLFEEYNYDQFTQILDTPSQRNVFIDFLVSEAVNNAPELKALDYNLEATDRSIILYGPRRFLPTVAAQAQYNRTFDQWGVGVPLPEFELLDNFSVGISLSVPIFDQNQQNINRQTAILQKEQLVMSQQNTTLSIERDVKDAVLDLINEISNIQLSEVSEESARASLDLTQTAYVNGAVTITELLDAQNNLLQAQLARANASYNYLLTALNLERTIGYFFLLNDDQANEDFTNRFQNYFIGVIE